MPKLNLAVYWTAACGGCDVAVLDIDENILKVGELCNIVLWPLAADGKYEDVRNMPDGFIDVCLFNGAIRSDEQEEMAHLLRKKSKILVAFGSCACFGGIPGLANFTTKDEILRTVYGVDTASTDNPGNTLPQPKFQVPEGELTLPDLYKEVYTLAQVVPVDYFIPGCPPPVDLIMTAINAIATNTLPPRGTVIAGERSVCHECLKKKEEKKVKEFKRPHEVKIDPEKCLLEQGIVCCGPATRGGCGARCTLANMPCRGCFGPAADVLDEGAKLVSSLASIIDSEDEKEIARICRTIVDPAGTFYRFGLPNSMLKRKRQGGKVS